MDSERKITLKDIEKAKARLEGNIQKTQIAFSQNISQVLGVQTFLKFENEQKTGSFKVRGALNKVGSLTEKEKKAGIVASSAGNHAQGVAYAATSFGVKSTIVMPRPSPIVKVEATKSYGAEVILEGEIYDQSYQAARRIEEEQGKTFVHPYNDPLVIAGQGTIGLEVIEQLSDLDSIVVPIGGGGLISGVATAIKSINPKCKIFGVVAKNTPGMLGLFKKDPEKYKYEGRSTICDGIAVKSPSSFIYQTYISPMVDDIIAVTDDEIAGSIVFLLERAKTVVEPSAAAALAGALKAKWPLGKKCCLLLSGGNIDLNLVSLVIERGLIKNGRQARIKVHVQDKPGQLMLMAKIVAEHEANVLHVIHDRVANELDIKEAYIELLIEAKGREHVELIKKALAESGAKVL